MSMDRATGYCMHEYFREDDRYRTCLDCGESECKCCHEAVCTLERCTDCGTVGEHYCIEDTDTHDTDPSEVDATPEDERTWQR